MASASPRTYGGRPVEDRRAGRRTAFIAAGLSEFGVSGYRNSSITSICRAAGLTRSQFYEHFDNREDLLLAVYDLIQNEAREAVTSALVSSTDQDISARARTAITAYARSIGDDPRRATISFVEIVGVGPQVERHRIEERVVWSRFVETEMRRQLGDEFAPPGGYAEATAGFIGALITLVHRWATSDPRPDLSGIVEVLTRFLLSMATN